MTYRYNIYEGFISITGSTEYEDLVIELNILIKVIGSFENQNQFFEYLKTREEYFNEKVRKFLQDFLNEGLYNLIIGKIRSDISDINVIGETDKIFLVENIEECELIICDNDYGDKLEGYLKQFLKVKL